MGEAVASPQRSTLPLTGERTVPGLARENYWFRRHEAAYVWAAEMLSSALQPTKPGRAAATRSILEAGCGEGFGADLLARSLGCSVLALDYDDAACSHAARTYPSITVARANLAALPRVDSTFAAAVSMQVVEHLWDVRGFLKALHTSLHSGGTAIVSTPNRLTFSPGLDRSAKPTNPFHVEEFDAQQLLELMHEAGFTDVAAYGLAHGERLVLEDEVNGSIVEAQIQAIVSDAWTPQLEQRVSEVTVNDFVIGDVSDSCLDLIVTGARR